MKVLKIFGKFFAVIVSFLYFLGLVCLMLLTFVSALFSRNFYSDLMENIDLDKIKVSDMGTLLEGSGLSEDASVEDAIVKYFSEGGVEEETAHAIIENKEIRTVVGNFVGDYMNYLSGGEEPTINKSDVETILTNPDVIKAAGQTPTQEDIDNVYDNLLDMVDDIVENGGEINGNTSRNGESVKLYK